MKEIDCVRVDEQDLVARYIGKRLGGPEADALEFHLAGCERCWAEVHAAAGVRAARGLDVFASPSAPGPARDLWTLLAAAAAVAMVAVGLHVLAERPELSPSERVWRSSGVQALSLTVESTPPGQLTLRWQSSPEAEIYVVEISAPDGSTVWERETSETSVALEVGAFKRSEPGISLFATVEALDSTHRTVARSERTRLPRS